MLNLLGKKVDEFESFRTSVSKKEPLKKRKRKINTQDNRGEQAGREKREEREGREEREEREKREKREKREGVREEERERE